METQEENQKIANNWEQAGLFRADDNITDRQKNRYVLDMFPYPSGDGLHVGHCEGYTASDIWARYLRMKGYNVLHPIGWDAFGLPAENYAIKRGLHPRETTDTNIKRFTKQIKSLGFSYDWSREINTSDPAYYKWTQWLFLKLYERGLAYRKKAKANWCNSCQTVLANEQVINGRCERCDNQVIQKELEQWFFKITDFAERLLNDIEKVDWPESIKQMQRNWIGRSEGAEVTFQVLDNKEKEMSSRANDNESRDPLFDDNPEIPNHVRDDGESITVFTTRPDTLYGATYMVLAPEHPMVDKITTDDQKSAVDEYKKRAAAKSLLQRTDLVREKTGVFTGAFALHPLTKKKLPIWIADYVVPEYGGGAVMAVPAHDERDFEFAKKYDLPIVEVISPDSNHHDQISKPYVDKGKLINSSEFDGEESEKAKKLITEKVGGKWKVTYRLRDWLISRQRYWGAPIPLIYCNRCLDNSKLITHDSKLKTDTKFQTTIIDGKEYAVIPVPEEQLPVELPDDVDFRPTGESPLAQSKSFHEVTCPKCGGKARRESDTMDTFVCSSWYFLRYCDPRNENKIFDDNKIKQWMPVDIYIGGAEHAVLHLLYSRFITKFLCDEGLVDFDEPFAKLRNQGIILGPDNQKMSKSRGNVVNPDDIVENYGPDVLRLYEMFMGPFDQPKAWDAQGIEGPFRFIKKVVKVFESLKVSDGDSYLPQTKRLVAGIEKKIKDFQFNTAISDFMTYVNRLPELKCSRADLEAFVKVLSPFAPYTAEILWLMLHNEASVASESWPEIGVAEAQTKCTIVIQVNGKTREKIEVDANLSEDEVIKIAKTSKYVLKYIKDQEIIKQIFVPNRLVNFVTK